MSNDGMLSQKEIDALLNVTDDDETTDEQEKYLSELEKDALGEIGNISLGSSATTLSTLLNQKVEITTPTVSIVRKTGLKEEFPYEHVKLQVDYMEGFDGENIFLMKAKDAAIISDIMLGGDGTNPDEELSEIHLSAVQEAMNQMMGASATSMSTVFDKRVDISPPIADYEDIDKLEEVKGFSEEELFVRISFDLRIGDIVDSDIMQLIPMKFAKELVMQLLDSSTTETEEMKSEQVQTTEESDIINETYDKPNQKQEEVANELHTKEEFTVNKKTDPQHIGRSIDESSSIQQATFSEFEQVDLNQQEQRNLDMLLDIPLKVSVELGRTKRTVEEILDLSKGSIIELDKLAGEPVDVLVNNKLVAKGEVVVIDENFGVRVTEVVSRTDRILNLN